MAVAQEKVKPVRTYYRNAADGSINDEYKLGNGNLTIQGGIDFVENYMNERIQYSVDKKVPKQVDKVYVIPLKDNTYGYYFTLRKTYEGVMFDTWKEGRNYQSGSSEALSVYDTAGVFMFEKDNVDFFYGNMIKVSKVRFWNVTSVTYSIFKKNQPISSIHSSITREFSPCF